jgi:hypothetical protein
MPIMNRLTSSTPLTSRRAAEGVGDLVCGTPNTSCSTKTARSAGVSVSSTTSIRTRVDGRPAKRGRLDDVFGVDNGADDVVRDAEQQPAMRLERIEWLVNWHRAHTSP